jgi:DNA repair photolyase
MTDKEYKQMSVKEFSKAAEVYETERGGIYKMCKKDYPDVLAELEKEDFLRRRIEVLEKMNERGIPTIVWLSPILPFINDTEDNITSILNECVRVGVKGIIDYGMGLTLREGDREYYYAALDRHFPGMKERYIKRYGNAYELPSPNAVELTRILKNICKENGLMSSPDDCFAYMKELPDKYRQLSLFDL